MIDPDNTFTRHLTSGNFLAGLAVGAVATFVLTNPAVQRAIFRTAAKSADLVRSGVAEARERFHDAEAEIHMESEAGSETS